MKLEYRFDESISFKKILLEKMSECDFIIPEGQIEIFVLERPVKKDYEYDSMDSIMTFQVWAYSSDDKFQIPMKCLVQDNEECLNEFMDQINNELEEKFADIVVQEDVVSDVKVSIAGQIGIVFGAVLKKEALAYKEVFEFVFSEIKKYNKRSNQVRDEDKFKKILGLVFQEKWVFQRRFVAYYIKKKHLPDVEVITELSASFYEGSENESRVYFTMDGMELVEAFVADNEEDRVICSKNGRMIRKLMEISKLDKIYLYAEKNSNATNESFVITSLIRMEKRDEENKERGTYIKFMGFLHWCVISDGRETVGYYQGKYKFNNTKEKEKYESDIDKINNVDKDMLKSLVKIVRKQKHGTSVILLSHENSRVVDDEVVRLCKVNRGIKVTSKICYDSIKKTWDEDALLAVTSIDGALMMDWEGHCLAIGTIVDGIATEKGDVSRGARYNSIYNYIMQDKDTSIKYIGIIASEDGMVNVIYNTIKKD